MVIEKEYQLWKVASKDRDRPALQHIFVTHWPIGPSYFTVGSHGEKCPGVPGAFFREDTEHRFCTCLDCQHAHAKANHTPDSPFNQADVVKTDLGIGIVFQTNENDTRVDFPHLGDLGVRWVKTAHCDYCWYESSKTDETPAIDPAARGQWTIGSLETLMNKQYGVAVATNGFALAIVPVTIERESDIGMFDARILQQAHRLSRAKTIPIFLRFDKRVNSTELVQLTNGHLIPRYRDSSEPASYPDYSSIVPLIRPKGGEAPFGAMSYDPKYFTGLVDAIGGKQATGVRAVFSEGSMTAPLMLELLAGKKLEGHFKPPMGLLMPIHDPLAIEWYKPVDWNLEEK